MVLFNSLWDAFKIIAILSCFAMSSFSQVVVSLKTNISISRNSLGHFYLKIQFVIHVVPFQWITYILVEEHIPTFLAYSLENTVLTYSTDNLDYNKLGIVVIFFHKEFRKPVSESPLYPEVWLITSKSLWIHANILGSQMDSEKVFKVKRFVFFRQYPESSLITQ